MKKEKKNGSIIEHRIEKGGKFEPKKREADMNEIMHL
jgi:hypothetical protein